jgi:hypothetical protein
MSIKRNIDARSIVVIAIGFIAGIVAYPALPGEFLDHSYFARLEVAFGLPTTALVIYALFRSLWSHDRVRSGNGAFEATYDAIVFRVLLFVVALHGLVMTELARVPLPRTWAMRAVVVLLGLTFVAVGNLLPPDAAQRRRWPADEADARQQPVMDASPSNRRLRDGVLGRHDRHCSDDAVW